MTRLQHAVAGSWRFWREAIPTVVHTKGVYTKVWGVYTKVWGQGIL
ncbi:hypothetical protein Rhal01_03665 [Rubritalea halochordaticola]|uniref:Uncharacterized protein n=1 Tax=Rubritalea halochordaticola TaxID=714537 RepID=A0ABP9V6E4_9BACT